MGHVPFIASELLVAHWALLVPTVILLVFLERGLRVEDLVAVATLIREQTVFLLLVGVQLFYCRTECITDHTVAPLQQSYHVTVECSFDILE